jgi:hypothetical protein
LNQRTSSSRNNARSLLLGRRSHRLFDRLNVRILRASSRRGENRLVLDHRIVRSAGRGVASAVDQTAPAASTDQMSCERKPPRTQQQAQRQIAENQPAQQAQTFGPSKDPLPMTPQRPRKVPRPLREKCELVVSFSGGNTEIFVT